MRRWLLRALAAGLVMGAVNVAFYLEDGVWTILLRCVICGAIVAAAATDRFAKRRPNES
jgi:hypothetical protein